MAQKLNLMTDGSVMKKLMTFSIPLFFCSVFQQLYSTVDAAIVGRYCGAEGLAAIGVTSQIIVLSVSIGIGLMLGIGVVVSEHCGRGEWGKVRQAVVIAIFVVLLSYLMKLIVGVFLAEPILRVINTPEDVLQNAVLYLKIIFGGGLFTYAYSMCIEVLRACGDGKRPLIFLAFSCVCNILLDLFFVCVLEMGVAGAAVATVISEGVALLLCLAYVKKQMPMLWVGKQDFQQTTKAMTAYVLKLSLPTCLQVSAVTFCTILVQSVINQYGTMVVAGYAAAVKIENFVALFITSLTGALNTFTAQNRGAGDYARIAEGCRLSKRVVTLFSMPASFCIYFFGRYLLSLFADGDSAGMIEEGYLYLQITCIFYLIFGLEQVYTSILRGMADVVMPLVIGGIQVGANFAVILLLEPLMGKTGIWWSVVIAWVLCFAVAKLRMRKHKL